MLLLGVYLFNLYNYFIEIIFKLGRIDNNKNK